MSVPVFTSEPAQFVAGETVKWTKTFDDFPASDGWALSYALVKSGSQITIDAVADGDAFAVTIPATTSAGYEAGRYSYQASVSKDGEVVVVGSGRIEIKPGFAALSEGYDDRSFAKKMVDGLREIMPKLAAKGVASYSIEGRSMTYRNMEELRADLNHWTAVYYQEERKAGRMRSRVIRPRLR